VPKNIRYHFNWIFGKSKRVMRQGKNLSKAVANAQVQETTERLVQKGIWRPNKSFKC
jgi:hypothetical protein